MDPPKMKPSYGLKSATRQPSRPDQKGSGPVALEISRSGLEISQWPLRSAAHPDSFQRAVRRCTIGIGIETQLGNTHAIHLASESRLSKSKTTKQPRDEGRDASRNDTCR